MVANRERVNEHKVHVQTGQCTAEQLFGSCSICCSPSCHCVVEVLCMFVLLYYPRGSSQDCQAKFLFWSQTLKKRSQLCQSRLFLCQFVS